MTEPHLLAEYGPIGGIGNDDRLSASTGQERYAMPISHCPQVVENVENDPLVRPLITTAKFYSLIMDSGPAVFREYS